MRHIQYRKIYINAISIGFYDILAEHGLTKCVCIPEVPPSILWLRSSSSGQGRTLHKLELRYHVCLIEALEMTVLISITYLCTLKRNIWSVREYVIGVIEVP